MALCVSQCFISIENIRLCLRALISNSAHRQLLLIYQPKDDDDNDSKKSFASSIVAGSARFVISAVFNPLRQAIWSRNTHMTFILTYMYIYICVYVFDVHFYAPCDRVIVNTMSGLREALWVDMFIWVFKYVDHYTSVDFSSAVFIIELSCEQRI